MAGRALLDWYDAHARTMPWRVAPADRARGVAPDPYGVWLSEVMLQQTTVAAVRDHYMRFVSRWPAVGDLARAADAEVMAAWAGLGYYARARNMLACARAVAALGGRFPDTEEGLLRLPGIGPYTAAAVAAIAFDRPAVVVDGNVERVVSRYFAVETPLPAARPLLRALAARLTPRERPGDHAQAMMDLGATVCTPRNPACALCPLASGCAARAAGLAGVLPRKLPRPTRPERSGNVYAGRRSDGAWLLERRPNRGLLGGMLAWPGSDWTTGAPATCPPAHGDWRALNLPVVHVFTHFRLTLTVWTAHLPAGSAPERGTFVAASDFDPRSLPTVMRKVHDLGWERGGTAGG